MHNFLSSHKMVWVFGAIGAVAILTMAIVAILSPRSNTPSNEMANKAEKQEKPAVEIKKVDESQLPDQFPAEIPLEAGAQVTGNYTATTPDGRFQATRSFETKKTLEENLRIYQDFLKSHGWTITSTINQTQLKAILATKDSSNIQINMSLNPTTKVKAVDITVTTTK